MGHTLAIKDNKGEYKRFSVSFEVGQYIKQLETFIRHPEKSSLKEYYSDRFGDNVGIVINHTEFSDIGLG